jgi:hypothetical protein
VEIEYSITHVIISALKRYFSSFTSRGERMKVEKGDVSGL